MQLKPGRPGGKWLLFGIGLIISAASIIYTNQLVEQIKKRETQQIEQYGRILEYLSTDSNDPNFYLILNELTSANTTLPVILTDEKENLLDFKNLPKAQNEDDSTTRMAYLMEQIELMRQQHDPIEITLEFPNGPSVKQYIFYKNSALLTRLTFYPYVQLSIIAVFIMVVLVVINYSRMAEQNRVWVGLAKETAHQLGTPLSSLMAWSEYFKSAYPNEMDMLKEFDKDIKSLEKITERFSQIGSVPQLHSENVRSIVDEIVSYLSVRLSSKIQVNVHTFPNDYILALMNKALFAWVIENLMKNAADAMEGKGRIDIKIMKVSEAVAIDVRDNGKGMSKSVSRQIFRPGFTSKRRGWGLGLALAKRIVENYHKGKIFVKESTPGKGTTFRILLQEGE